MPSRSRVGDILLKAKVIDELQLRSALAQQDQWGGRLGKVIADMGLADEDVITSAVSAAMKVPKMQVGGAKDPGALAKLDAAFCEQHAVFPVQLTNNGKTLVLAMADPSDLEVMDMAAGRARSRVNPVIAGETEILSAIARCYRGVEGRAPERSRARQAVQAAAEEGSGDDGGEMKITDMSGRTLVKMSPYLADPEGGGPATDPSASAPRVTADYPSLPTPAPMGNAGDVLDDILSGRALVTGLTAEEMQRLEKLRTNQAKSAKVIRAVMELLMEKGYTTQKELVGRIKS